MKPEPLKDKKNPVVEGQSYINLFKEKDIKSAVEWLINIMNKESEPSNVAYSDRKNVDLEIAITNIKEAFEDVTK